MKRDYFQIAASRGGLRAVKVRLPREEREEVFDLLGRIWPVLGLLDKEIRANVREDKKGENIR